MSAAERAKRIMASVSVEQARQLVGLLPQQILVPVTVVEPAVESAAAHAGEMYKQAPRSRAMTRVVRGPLVRADEANLNGAVFLDSDLQFGLDSLMGQPLTVNHHEVGAGYIESATIERQADLGTYIDIVGRVWATRFAETWRDIEAASLAGDAYFSMEAVPSAIGCMECGLECRTMAQACSHIVNRSAARRMIDPTFIGAALVLPPEKPGWPDARLSIG